MNAYNKAVVVLTQIALQTGICITTGWLLATTAIENIVFNADALSPYFQAQLITTGLTADPTQLSFARIPSIFPDLATLIGLSAIDPSSNAGVILPRYSWLIASVFVFLQAEFIRLSLNQSLSKLQTTLITSFITLGLAITVEPIRETIGLLVTPVHHGGNIINTYLLGCLVVWRQPEANLKGHKSNVKLILGAALISISLASNKLFIFTALMPATLASSLTHWAAKKKPRFFSIIKAYKQHKIALLILTCACIAGFTLPLFLNGQCSMPIVIRAWKSYQDLINWIFSDTFYTLCIALSLATIALQVKHYARSFGKSKRVNSILLQPEKSPQFLVGIVFLFTFTFSPLVFVWLLGELEILPTRYIIAIGAGSCSILILAVATALMRLEAIIHHHHGHRGRIYSIGLILSGLAIEVPEIGIKKWNLQDTMQNSFRAREKDFFSVATTINKLELTHGLSDFWGVTSGTFANIQSTKSHNVSVQPIHKNGLPDLWATSTHQFLDHKKSIKPYNFVITSDDSFHQNIADVYGTPSETVIIDGSQSKLLLYNDTNSRNRIQNHLNSKLSTFRRQCNRNKPDFVIR